MDDELMVEVTVWHVLAARAGNGYAPMALAYTALATSAYLLRRFCRGLMLLIMVDAHSKWIKTVPMRQVTTQSTITALLIFATHGVPENVVPDSGIYLRRWNLQCSAS